MTASNLRAMAAAIETPGDLTAQELEQVSSDIVAYLLAQADVEDLREDAEAKER